MNKRQKEQNRKRIMNSVYSNRLVLSSEKDREYYDIMRNKEETTLFFHTGDKNNYNINYYLIRYLLVNGDFDGKSTSEFLDELDYKTYPHQQIFVLDPDSGMGEKMEEFIVLFERMNEMYSQMTGEELTQVVRITMEGFQKEVEDIQEEVERLVLESESNKQELQLGVT